jgi:hypothetical protein
VFNGAENWYYMIYDAIGLVGICVKWYCKLVLNGI